MSLTLGIDSGSVAVGYVLVDENAKVVCSGYRMHNGDPPQCARRLLAESGVSESVYVAAVVSAPTFVEGAARFDDTVCWATAAKRLHPGLRSLLVIGGERFALISFDENGDYRRMKTNTSCAAGTGSFVDQQARRLHLSGGAELSDLAQLSEGEVPSIASRCSVFAKTDIIHAQQEGYQVGEICDGICFGLARNAADVLFDAGKVDTPAVFAGGVARNAAVKRHLEAYLDTRFLTDDYAHLYGALGAAYCFRARSSGSVALPLSEIIQPVEDRKSYYFPPLQLVLSAYPSFDYQKRSIYRPQVTHREKPAPDNPVEVDVYQIPAEDDATEAFLGIDVGSTSTKAALCTTKGVVIAGFYTRTAGRPIEAVMRLFEAIDNWLGSSLAKPNILGAATTGSGRKLSGAVIGADLVIDEITAHARAALDLYPDVDTIIEIGGQDSKFTALKERRVIFSKMNSVCAAGTGSFLEEQAARLNVPIEEYAETAMGSKAPLTSDRCTVFMERDINSFLHKNYSAQEILAAAVHSVCENYLLKVASEGHIGSNIVFQGATAKNHALIAALEQKLGKKVNVSRYCHLTGAVGAALCLIDKGILQTAFRGISLFRKRIPVTRENCGLCRNHCRLTTIEIDGEKIAYGFLCGRDYNTKRFVSRNTSGFDLLAERGRLERAAYGVGAESDVITRGSTIGIPAGLHLAEDLPFWRTFFHTLGFPAVDSAEFEGAVKNGKLVAGAEFCAPMAAFHGHARYLAEKADILFLPTYIENIHTKSAENGALRKLCYYTQFASVLVKNLEERGGANNSLRCAAPVFDPRLGRASMLKALRDSLSETTGKLIDHVEIERAFKAAEAARQRANFVLRKIFASRKPAARGFDVVLLGRPYTVLNRFMNKGIPDAFDRLGIRAYYQDMLTVDSITDEEVKGLLDIIHWDYAARILEAAAACAAAPDLYPVLITSFKCAPDSFLLEYFSRIMDRFEKPYLILQLDEHASSVGYETRIEAAIRSFHNHYEKHKTKHESSAGRSFSPLLPRLTREAAGKTMLFPNWDSIASPLVTANLKWAGWDVRLLEETDGLIKESMKYNTGQCIPVHIILHECAEYIRKHRLQPEKTVLWMAESKWACNVPMYPYYLKTMLNTLGGGLEHVGVYLGTLLHAELPKHITMRGYFAYLFAGLIRRLSCGIRPYERRRGETDGAVKTAVSLFQNAFLGESDLHTALVETVELFGGIACDWEPRPKAALFGDLYVRDNDVMNQDLIRCIEESGGEVVITPYSDYLRVVSPAYFRKWFKTRRFGDLVKFRSMLAVVDLIERRFRRLFPDFVSDDRRLRNNSVEQELSRFNVSLFHEGESYENLLKITHILKNHPDVALFVQTNPAFCCPSLVTEAMSADIERITGVPVVSVTYDGTESLNNSVVIPYIHFAAEQMHSNRGDGS